MDDDNKKIVQFYKKRIEPFVAIFILAFLITSSWLVYQDNILKDQISQNCGWGEEDFYCFCEKSEAMELKNKVEEEMNQAFHDAFNESNMKIDDDWQQYSGEGDP